MQFITKLSGAAFLALFISVLGASSASAQTYVTTSVAATAPSTQCVPLSQILVRGSNDYYTQGQVSQLQQFLVSRGYLSQYQVIGVFGPATFKAVTQFQAAYRIYPVTGGVGPLTRAAIYQQTCGKTPVPPVTNVTIQSITPNPASIGSDINLVGSGFTTGSTVYLGSGAITETQANYNGTQMTFKVPEYIAPYCAPGMYCTMMVQQLTPGTYNVYVQNANGTSNIVSLTIGSTATTQAPVINSLDAPTQLYAGQQGTWTVNATTPWYDPNNRYFQAPVRYSVVWGDEMYTQPYGYAVSAQNPTVQSSSSFTHTYTTAGTYKPVFTVTLDNGKSVSASASVNVSQYWVNY
ncbi:MAG: hypothetical protein JWO43_591 [Candidatus Adlerbacteria bacterium]|nr:hypothetical protein [Candidatus Adlerbacteria bacterium]